MSENYQQEELTINLAKAHWVALGVFIFASIVFGIPYFLMWAKSNAISSHKNLLTDSGDYNTPLLLAIGLVGVVVHELLHGITWSLFARRGFKSIRFGVVWKYLSPYCHCNEALTVKQYIIGAIMPGVVLGILPLLLALVTGNMPLLLFGIIFTVAAT
ncbi:MAG TPA: DUF3267 domain-containing protein, partial [Cytophagales bacterium]|nr:DUF3267 domain-containing protein [Cytophagales bacterium]